MIGFGLSFVKDNTSSILNTIGFPFCLDISFVAAAFIILGFVSKELTVRKKSLKAEIGICVLSLFGSFLYMLNNVPSPFSDRMDGYIYMARGIYGNYILFILSAILGSSFIISISKLTENSYFQRVKSTLIWLGKNSLGIFLVHIPIISILSYIMGRICDITFVNLIVVSITTVLLSSLLVYVINRISPSLFGN